MTNAHAHTHTYTHTYTHTLCVSQQVMSRPPHPKMKQVDPGRPAIGVERTSHTHTHTRARARTHDRTHTAVVSG